MTGRTFSIPCESWGSATKEVVIMARLLIPFSIPCESWGSATAAREVIRFSTVSSFSIPCESWGSATDSWRDKC